MNMFYINYNTGAIICNRCLLRQCTHNLDSIYDNSKSINKSFGLDETFI